jgi:hypothetical protein
MERKVTTLGGTTMKQAWGIVVCWLLFFLELSASSVVILEQVYVEPMDPQGWGPGFGEK